MQKKMQRIGMMIYKLREDIGATQKEIARGIMSVSDMSRLESGEKEIDYILLEALFQRLGKSVDKLELIISARDYRLLSLQEDIENSFSERNYDKVKYYLEIYKESADNDKRIHIQYVKQVEAAIAFLCNKDIQKTEDLLIESIELTFPEWQNDTWNEVKLCTQEIRVMLMIAYIRMVMKQKRKACHLLERIRKYIERNILDEEEKVKSYPQTMVLLGKIYYSLGRYKTAYLVSKKGKNCLIENGSLIMMEEILELEEMCLLMLGKEDDLKLCLQYREAIKFLFELIGAKQEEEILLLLMKCSNQKEYIIDAEMIRELRLAKGLSQESLSDDICTQETLARIEGGKRSLSKRNFYKLMDRMGVDRGTCSGYIESEFYYLHEMVRIHNRSVSKGEKDTAKELLKKIKQAIDMSIVTNQQFVETEEIREQLWDKKISNEQAINYLENLLHLTMPIVEGKTAIYRIPFRQEFVILNLIALCNKKIGNIDATIDIYKQIYEKYENGKLSMKYHAVPGLILYVNYAGALEITNQLEQSHEIAVEGIAHLIRCGRGDNAGQIVANLSCIFEKQNKFIDENEYLRKAYFLSLLYNRMKEVAKIRDIYLQKNNEAIDCFLRQKYTLD